MFCLLIDCNLPFIGLGWRQERDRLKAGERQERIYFGLDEMCSAFYWIVSCLLIVCVLPFDGLRGRQDISPTWQDGIQSLGEPAACRPAGRRFFTSPWGLSAFTSLQIRKSSSPVEQSEPRTPGCASSPSDPDSCPSSASFDSFGCPTNTSCNDCTSGDSSPP